jgi:hypothetical protein
MFLQPGDVSLIRSGFSFKAVLAIGSGLKFSPAFPIIIVDEIGSVQVTVLLQCDWDQL